MLLKRKERNEVGMGILPLTFKEGENADSLGLTGREKYNISLNGGDLKVRREEKS